MPAAHCRHYLQLSSSDFASGGSYS